jgi:hypothetical protein
VAKLLAVARDRKGTPEGKTFSAAAVRIMQEYHLAQDDVEKVVYVRVFVPAPDLHGEGVWQSYLLTAIGNYYDCPVTFRRPLDLARGGEYAKWQHRADLNRLSVTGPRATVRHVLRMYYTFCPVVLGEAEEVVRLAGRDARFAFLSQTDAETADELRYSSRMTAVSAVRDWLVARKAWAARAKAEQEQVRVDIERRMRPEHVWTQPIALLTGPVESVPTSAPRTAAQQVRSAAQPKPPPRPAVEPDREERIKKPRGYVRIDEVAESVSRYMGEVQSLRNRDVEEVRKYGTQAVQSLIFRYLDGRMDIGSSSGMSTLLKTTRHGPRPTLAVLRAYGDTEVASVLATAEEVPHV